MTLPWAENSIIEYSKRLTDSYFFGTKKALIESDADQRENSFFLYHAPFILISHGPGTNPVINYANSKAQMLLGMPWEELINTSSGYLSKLDENNQALPGFADTGKDECISNYSTTLIAGAEHLRFKIKDSRLWRVMNDRKMCIGQAIMFVDWETAGLQST